MSIKSHSGLRDRRWEPSLLLSLVLIVVPACQQQQQPRETVEGNPHAEEVVQGRKAFETYCASCHGADAHGNGPVASVLTVPPPDLTQLKSNFDGVYPSEYVLRTIDGRHEFLAHGTRQMPIWGNIWREDSTAGSEVKVQRRLNALLHYLETIQE